MHLYPAGDRKIAFNQCTLSLCGKPFLLPCSENCRNSEITAETRRTQKGRREKYINLFALGVLNVSAVKNPLHPFHESLGAHKGQCYSGLRLVSPVMLFAHSLGWLRMSAARVMVH